MIEHILDNRGRCVAYLEWALVDDKGIIDDKGTYVFVREMWIWSGMKKGYSIIKGFIKKICETFPQAKYGYWRRPKHNGRVRVYKREVIYGR